jgi:hypothetical protein
MALISDPAHNFNDFTALLITYIEINKIRVFLEGVPASRGFITSVHKIGRRGIVEILNTLFGLTLSLGSVCNSIERVNPELEPVVMELKKSLPEAGNINADETGWKCNGNRLNGYHFPTLYFKTLVR